jgi:hypothetical protein
MREGTKTFKFLEMMKRPDGATFKELLAAAVDWKENTLRGFLSANKKRGVESFRREDGTHAYRVVEVADEVEHPDVPPAA